jgi:glutaredoxin-like protein
MLDEKIRQEVQNALGELADPVRLVVFTQEFECQFCRENRQLAEEVAALNPQISTEVYNYVLDRVQVEQYGIDQIPAIAVIGEKDYGIRFYGIPSGYEFGSLIQAIQLVSAGQPLLTDEGLKFIESVEQPLNLQVFVTPTCPYCPQAVLLAFNLALANDQVRASMVEASEFPHLAIKYQVMGVPRTVINEDYHIEGAAPEPMVLDKIREALDESE